MAIEIALGQHFQTAAVGIHHVNAGQAVIGKSGTRLVQRAFDFQRIVRVFALIAGARIGGNKGDVLPVRAPFVIFQRRMPQEMIATVHLGDQHRRAQVWLLAGGDFRFVNTGFATKIAPERNVFPIGRPLHIRSVFRQFGLAII